MKVDALRGGLEPGEPGELRANELEAVIIRDSVAWTVRFLFNQKKWEDVVLGLF